MVTYCTSKQVFDFLQLSRTYSDDTDFDAETFPTKNQVEEWIEENEDYIDEETLHAWRTISVSEETHNIPRSYNYSDGAKIFLNHRIITTLASGTDKIEVWNGTEYVDYVATKTEGRNKDWWIDQKLGILFIKTFPRYFHRDYDVRVTYRFGETTVKKDIRKACVRLTAIDVLQSDDKSILIPEGSSNISLETKSEKWQEQADKWIQNNRELPVAVL